MLLVDSFIPARGLENGNAQTLFAYAARRAPPLVTRRERIHTPDDDFFDVDWVDGAADQPTLIILHGLEGSATSGYVRTLAWRVARARWSVAMLNFRSCSGSPNTRARSYSSGSYADVELLIERIRGQRKRLAAVGFSLGGSVLLNYLAQRASTSPIEAAATVSVPFDLQACADLLDTPKAFLPLYLQTFLMSMKLKALEKAKRFPSELDADAIRRARTIQQFDDAVTARVFGFSSAREYYRECSASRQLHHIRTPTLFITAMDDPFAPAAGLPTSAHNTPHLEVCVTRSGGHVGFVAGSLWRPQYWAEQTVAEWLINRLQSRD